MFAALEVGFVYFDPPEADPTGVAELDPDMLLDSTCLGYVAVGVRVLLTVRP